MNAFDPRFRRPSDGAGVVVVPQPRASGSKAPGASRGYQLQLKRIQKLQQQLLELDGLAQTHRQALQQQVHPLQIEHRQQLRAMVLLIDERLQGKMLAAPQRRAAVTILCGTAATLAREGDKAMAALHDRHSPTSLADQARARSEAMRADIEAALGQPLHDLPLEANAEQILAAGMARLREQRAQADEDKRARAERRRAKKQKPPKIPAGQQAGDLPEGSALLRSLFRRLASALHPDRESDPAARERKTALMSEANAAHARRDLLALLQLQQDAELDDPLDESLWGESQLAAMTALLKQRVADLERERAGRQDALAQEFQVPPGLGVTPGTLQSVLLEQVWELAQALELMRADARLAQTDAGFKRWLRAQAAVMQQLAV
jgi:hypothetical protein